MNSALWELVVSVLKHAGIVGVVAFLVALGQGLSGADFSSFGPYVQLVVVPTLIFLISTVVKGVQKGVELKLSKPAEVLPLEDDDRNDEFPTLPFGA